MRIVFLLLIISFNNYFISQSHVWKVEPPNWWVNMPDKNLQLMIYGDEIGKRRPVINHESISIKRYSSDNNINYLFLDLIIGDIDEAISFEIQFYYEEDLIDKITYNLKERNSSKSFKNGVSSSDVIYLISADRFNNGDNSNDKNKEFKQKKVNRNNSDGRHGGDLQGVIDNLNYIKDMGFTSICMNPVLENNAENKSYNGFSCTDMYKIDPRYGANKLYKELSNECHKKNLKLIKDLVLNHIGSEHWWMNDIPTKKWFNNHKSIKLSNERVESLNDPYASKRDLYNYKNGWLEDNKPDLNQSNKYLSTYLIQNAIWWVEYADLDGVRVPNFSYVDNKFLNKWSLELQKFYPNINIIADGNVYNKSSIGLMQKNSSEEEIIDIPVLLNSKPTNISSLMDYPLQNAITNSFHENDSKNENKIQFLYESLVDDYLYSDPNKMIVFLDNYNTKRVYSSLNYNLDNWKKALAYLLITRGIPQIYYGSEILLSDRLGPGKITGCDLDFPGGWKSDKVNGFSGKGLNEEQVEAQIFSKKLLNWRLNNKVLHNGKLMHFAPALDELYCLVRYNKEKMVLLFLNNDDINKTIDVRSYINDIPLKSKQGIALDFLEDKEMNIKDKINIEKNGFLIIEYFF